MTAAQALLAALHAGMSPHLALWASAIASRRAADRDPMVRGLHNVPTEDEYDDQIRRDLPLVRSEMVDLRKEWGS